jgi:hypothetical protein
MTSSDALLLALGLEAFPHVSLETFGPASPAVIVRWEFSCGALLVSLISDRESWS